jgi:hypothetical protein
MIVIIFFVILIIGFVILDQPYRKQDKQQDLDIARYKKLHDSWDRK